VLLIAVRDCLPPTSGLASWEKGADIRILYIDMEVLDRCRTLYAVAHSVVERVKKVQPQGPYQIAGYENAGYLAYEVARQLIGADEKVNYLASVNSNKGAHQACSCGRLNRHISTYVLEPLPIPQTKVDTGCATLKPLDDGVPVASVARNGVRNIRGGCSEGVPREASASKSLNLALSHSASIVGENYQPPRELSFTSIVTIQSGRMDTIPYICVPGAGASVVDFLPFAKALGTRHTVHGFQARGLDGELLPYVSVEAAARKYVQEISTIRKSGPVHLVGHSFGGWIAFEVACQLQSTGIDVASLVLLDSQAPGTGRSGLEYTRPQALAVLVELYEQVAREPLGLTCQDFEGKTLERQLELLHMALIRSGVISRNTKPRFLKGVVRCFEAALRTTYRPTRRFAGPTYLVVARKDGATLDHLRARNRCLHEAWQTHLGLVCCHVAPANHMRILKQPCISTIVDWMMSPVVAENISANESVVAAADCL
jgi:thioesterase domain-containing protein